ncbi:MAG TPA: thioesterase domain-containing protein, partial [Alphaproteobacteria bacterium]|nr:thioesterase domain-containing protein [Alphaproteobacteria bacterium]
DFFLLGGDSLQAVDLFLRIEKDVGRRLPRSVLFEAGTVAKMARRIETSVPSSCVVPIQAKGERVPFFCVHDRSGEVLNFRRLAHFLGEDQPFYGIQSLGLEGDEPPFTSVEDMAAHYLAEVRKVQPEGPYLLGGYSLGGHVAYVMAQQLQKAGEEVALVALFDTYSNAGRRRTGVGTWLAHHGKQMVGLPARQLPGYLWLRLTNLAGMIRLAVSVKSFTLAWRYFESRGKPVPRALRRPVFANHMVLRGYQPEPYNGDVVLFKAERYAWSHADQHEGWKDLVNGRLTVVPLEGRHYDIFASPYVEHLADALGEAIARTRPNASAPRFGQETQVS